MKNQDPLHQFFEQSDFDQEVPQFGHLKRFEHRLETQHKKNKISFKWMSIAASILLVIGFSIGVNSSEKSEALANFSPKMQEAENFFINTIQLELKQVEKARNPETEQIIEDALNQLELLEDTYNELLASLSRSNDDRRIIHAMINNYQNRITVLQDVLTLIERMQDLKQEKNEENYV